MADSDDDQEDLISPENELATDICHSDNDWSSSDEEPLKRLIPASSKNWVWDNDFQPSKNVGTVTYDDHVKSPYEYFKKYINDSFFENVAAFTNMREVCTKGHSLQTSAVEIQKVFGCSMLIEIYGLPRFKMYRARDTRVPLVADNIPRNRFFKLRSRLKVVDDNVISDIQKSLDRFLKVRPLLDAVQRGCRLNERTYDVSIDEQMIPFTGHVMMRQFVRGKPNPVGLKNFVMATPTGIPLDFYIYEGKGSSVESVLTTTPEKLDIGRKDGPKTHRYSSYWSISLYRQIFYFYIID
nr:unnamed protein product [Callosobruchus chinensis]